MTQSKWDDEPCQLVTKSLGRGGYPLVKRKGKTVRLTRLVLEKSLGRPILPNHQACHHCDHPNCITPSHLYEATQGRNIRDGWARGRMKSNWATNRGTK